jgi:hypothetical protein
MGFVQEIESNPVSLSTSNVIEDGFGRSIRVNSVYTTGVFVLIWMLFKEELWW